MDFERFLRILRPFAARIISACTLERDFANTLACSMRYNYAGEALDSLPISCFQAPG
jgi:hypothetical protein